MSRSPIGWLRVLTLVIVGLGALLALPACEGISTQSKEGTGAPTDPVAVCTKDGQTCRYSEGKLGLCAQKLKGCDGGLCFSCMSLH